VGRLACPRARRK